MEWQCILKDATGLIYFGSERFLANFRPEVLVSMNIPGMHIKYSVKNMCIIL